MLGEHLVGDEGPVRTDGAVRDDALTLAEQVGQHAGVLDRDLVGEVGEHEAHLRSPGLRVTLPFTTMPPTRKRFCSGAWPAAIWLGS